MTVSQEEFESLKAVVANLRRQITDMEEQMNNHVGLDWGATGINYPHPNLQVSTAEFGGGVSRLDQNGIQIKSDSDQIITVFFVDNFVDDVYKMSGPYASIGGEVSDSVPLGRFLATAGAGAGNLDNEAQLELNARADSDNDYARLWVNGNGANIQVGAYRLADGEPVVVASGAPFRIPTKAGGYTMAVDGDVDYDTTADKMRLRQNGSTVNIATEDYVDTAIAGASGHTDIMSRLSLRF